MILAAPTAFKNCKYLLANKLQFMKLFCQMGAKVFDEL
jgi:hypothetical protein